MVSNCQNYLEKSNINDAAEPDSLKQLRHVQITIVDQQCRKGLSTFKGQSILRKNREICSFNLGRQNISYFTRRCREDFIRLSHCHTPTSFLSDTKQEQRRSALMMCQKNELQKLTDQSIKNRMSSLFLTALERENECLHCCGASTLQPTLLQRRSLLLKPFRTEPAWEQPYCFPLLILLPILCMWKEPQPTQLYTKACLLQHRKMGKREKKNFTSAYFCQIIFFFFFWDCMSIICMSIAAVHIDMHQHYFIWQ